LCLPKAGEQGADPGETSPGPFEIAAFRRKLVGHHAKEATARPWRSPFGARSEEAEPNEVRGQGQAQKKRKTLPLAVQKALAESEQEASPEPEPLEMWPEAEQELEEFNWDRCS
jgi:hypothetical protein